MQFSYQVNTDMSASLNRLPHAYTIHSLFGVGFSFQWFFTDSFSLRFSRFGVPYCCFPHNEFIQCTHTHRHIASCKTKLFRYLFKRNQQRAHSTLVGTQLNSRDVEFETKIYKKPTWLTIYVCGCISGSQ